MPISTSKFYRHSIPNPFCSYNLQFYHILVPFIGLVMTDLHFFRLELGIKLFLALSLQHENQIKEWLALDHSS